MDARPPREWLIENFVHGGRVKFCPKCRIVPAVALGKGCACGGDRATAYRRGTIVPWAEEDADVNRLHAVRNYDTRNGWYCFYNRTGQSEREQLRERARREIPGLRREVAANLNELRRIAGRIVWRLRVIDAEHTYMVQSNRRG